MTSFSSTITDFVAGDALDVNRTVTDIPTGRTLTKAWLTFKRNRYQSDSDALLQKTITPSQTSSGQITDTGSSGTGQVTFQLSSAETLALPIEVDTPYEIKVLTDANKPYTLEQGVYRATRRITEAVS